MKFEVSRQDERRDLNLFHSYLHLVSFLRLVMAAHEDSDSSQRLDNSSAGVVGKPEPSSPSSQDDSSSHEIEAVAEGTTGPETKAEAARDDTLLAEPPKSSSASKEAHAE